MDDGWVTGYSIAYDDGGAARGIELLGTLTSKLGEKFDLLTMSVRGATDALIDFGYAAKDAGDAFASFDGSMGATAANARRAAASYDLTADSLTATAAAYDAAAASAGRYDAALLASRRNAGGSSYGGRSAASSMLGSFTGGGAGAAGAGIGLVAGGPVGAAAGWLAGAAATAAKDTAIAAAGYTIDALYEAGHFQTTMAAIGNVSGAKGAQLDQLRSLMYAQGAKYAMSPDEAGRQYLDMVRQTPTLTTKQRNELFPSLGKASVVLSATRGMSPTDTSEGAVSFVHMFQAYSAAAMKQAVDLFVRSNEVMGISPTQALRQYSYFIPSANRLGVSEQNDLVMQAELANMGMGKQRGGTGVRALLLSSAGIGLTPKAETALGPKGLGILDAHGKPNFYKKGTDGQMHLDPMAVLNQLNADDRKMGDWSFLNKLHAGYGVQGGNIGLALTSNVQTAQRKGIINQLNRPGLGLDPQFDNIAKQFDVTFKQSGKDFQALATSVGNLMLPAATAGFHDLNIAMTGAVTWLQQNKAGTHEFTQALTDDIALIGGTMRDHKGDFVALADDAARAGLVVNTLARDLIKLAGPMITLTRDIADVGTGRVVTEMRNANEATRRKFPLVPDNPADGAAYNKIFGRNGALTHALVSGAAGGHHGPQLPGWLGNAPIIQNNIDARGMNASEVAKAVAAGTETGLKKMLRAPGNPQHTAARHGAIQTGPHQTTRSATPISAGG